MRTLKAPSDAVLIIIDYLTSAVLFFATQRSADYFTYQAQDSSGGQPKTGLFYSAHTEILKHKQVSVVGSLADEFRMYLANHTARTIAADKERLAQTAEPAPATAPARYIAFEVRPCVETEGNDESTSVESFLTLAQAQAAYRSAVEEAAEQDGNQMETVFDVQDTADDHGIKLFWTVYGVNPDGTSEALAGLATEAQAFELLAKLGATEAISGVSGTVRYSVAPQAIETADNGLVILRRSEHGQRPRQIVTISGGRATARIVGELVKASQWFAVEPLPEDEYEVTVKREAADILERAIEAAKAPAPHPDNTRRLFDDGRRIEATDGDSYAPTTTEAAPTLTREQQRLEYLRGELRAQRISYGELVELQDLVPFIAPDDVELLEAAGVPEFPEAEPEA